LPHSAFVDFAALYATALGKNPWIGIFPCLMENITVATKNGDIWLVDQKKNSIPVASIGNTAWKILAHSGGFPMTVFGEWREGLFSALSVIDNGSIVSL
jgi:hypothetical protein